MTEDRVYVALDKIEKLIVDGQTEITNILNHRMDGLEGRMDGLDGRMSNLEGRMDRLEIKVDKIDKKHDVNATALYDLLQDVDNKLDQHLRQPVHIAG